MARHDRVRALVVLRILVALASGGGGGCADSTGPSHYRGFPPETELTYAPVEGDTTFFRVRLYWYGHDRDGEVAAFRFALDGDTMRAASTWRATTARETTLVFTVDPVEAVGGHVFWMAAEDNEGMLDPTPAKRFFSARTIPPTSHITRGPSAPGTTVGRNLMMEWSGVDPDGGMTGGPAAVDSFEVLLLRAGASADPSHPPLPTFDRTAYVAMINAATGRSLPAPHDDWKWMGVRARSHTFTNLAPGRYAVAVHAVDAAGAQERPLAYGTNIRDFVVPTPPPPDPYPHLRVQSDLLLGAIGGDRPGGGVTAAIEAFEGGPLSFTWQGVPGATGVPIAGYGYGVDDTTSSTWTDLDSTRVAATLSGLEPGPHFLFVRAVDAAGLASIAILAIDVIHPAFLDPLAGPPVVLLVDDFAAPPGSQLTNILGSPNYPSDSVMDSWWIENVQVPLAREFGVVFRVKDAVAEGALTIEGRATPSLAELRDVRVVIWAVDLNNSTSSPTALWNAIVGDSYSELTAYLRAGGTLIVTGFQVGSNTIAPTTTLASSYLQGMCASLDEGTREFALSYFPRNFMGIDGAVSSDQALRSNGSDDFVEARVTDLGRAMGFESARVDTGAGAKWDPYVFPGAELEPNQALSPGLNKIEGWKMQAMFGCNPLRTAYRAEDPSAPIAAPILTYHGVPKGVLLDRGPSPREDLIVGVATQAHDLGNQGGGVITPGNAAGAIGRMVFLGFPVYYVEDAQATALMRAAFRYVNASPTLPGIAP